MYFANLKESHFRYGVNRYILRRKVSFTKPTKHQRTVIWRGLQPLSLNYFSWKLSSSCHVNLLTVPTHKILRPILGLSSSTCHLFLFFSYQYFMELFCVPSYDCGRGIRKWSTGSSCVYSSGVRSSEDVVACVRVNFCREAGQRLSFCAFIHPGFHLKVYCGWCW